MKDKVLITGVAGFIGSNLLDFLIKHTDWEIDGIDNLQTGSLHNISSHNNNARFVFKQQDCSKVESLAQYKYVFHLAALPRIQPSFEFINEHIHANLNESIALIEIMVRERHFPTFIYSSSSAIYGTPTQIPTGEKERIDCLSPYAFQKYEVEKYLELLSTRYPLNYVNLRYFNPYGPRSFNPANKFNAYSSVIGIFLDRHMRGLPLLVTGDGLQKRDFIHVQDLAKANYHAAIYGAGMNTSFNIGKGDTITVLEVAKKISSSIQFIDKREGEAEITFADISKAKQMLNWSPTIDLDNYLNEALHSMDKTRISS